MTIQGPAVWRIYPSRWSYTSNDKVGTIVSHLFWPTIFKQGIPFQTLVNFLDWLKFNLRKQLVYIYPCALRNATNFVEEHPVERDEEKKKGYGAGYGVPMI